MNPFHVYRSCRLGVAVVLLSITALFPVPSGSAHVEARASEATSIGALNRTAKVVSPEHRFLPDALGHFPRVDTLRFTLSKVHTTASNDQSSFSLVEHVGIDEAVNPCRQPVSWSSIEDCINQIHHSLEQIGHPRSRVTIASIDVVDEVHHSVSLNIEPGPEATLDSVLIKGVSDAVLRDLHSWSDPTREITANSQQIERLRRVLLDHPRISDVEWSGWQLLSLPEVAGQDAAVDEALMPEGRDKAVDEAPIPEGRDEAAESILIPVYTVNRLTPARVDGLLGWKPGADGSGGVVGSVDLHIPTLVNGLWLDLSLRRMNPLQTSLTMSVMKGWRQTLEIDLGGLLDFYQQDSLYLERRIGVFGRTSLIDGLSVHGSFSNQRLLPGQEGDRRGLSASEGWAQGLGLAILPSLRSAASSSLLLSGRALNGRSGVPSLGEGWGLNRAWGVILFWERTDRNVRPSDGAESSPVSQVAFQRWSMESRILLPVFRQASGWTLALSGTWISLQDRSSSYTAADLIRIGGDPGFRGMGEDRYRADQMIKADVELRRELSADLSLFSFTSLGRIRQPTTQLVVLEGDANGTLGAESTVGGITDLISMGVGLTTRTPLGRWIMSYAILPTESWTAGVVHLRVRGDL